jgi:propanol-preferring alcohol dehydrogenase
MVIGVAGGKLEYHFNTLPSDATLTHPCWGSVSELAEVLELPRSGHITAHASTSRSSASAMPTSGGQSGILAGHAVITSHG